MPSRRTAMGEVYARGAGPPTGASEPGAEPFHFGREPVAGGVLDALVLLEVPRAVGGGVADHVALLDAEARLQVADQPQAGARLLGAVEDLPIHPVAVLAAAALLHELDSDRLPVHADGVAGADGEPYALVDGAVLIDDEMRRDAGLLGLAGDRRVGGVAVEGVPGALPVGPGGVMEHDGLRSGELPGVLMVVALAVAGHLRLARGAEGDELLDDGRLDAGRVGGRRRCRREQGEAEKDGRRDARAEHERRRGAGREAYRRAGVHALSIRREQRASLRRPAGSCSASLPPMNQAHVVELPVRGRKELRCPS